MPPTIVIVGTLDTKGEEVGFLKEGIEEEGCSTIVVDVGTLHEPAIKADIPREQTASRGGESITSLLEKRDRRLAVQTMINGAARVLRDLYDRNSLSGVISVGGGTGTHIGMGVMRALPLGIPKFMVSTVASRDMSDLIGTKDITIMHSVIDILGLNPVSKKILGNAAAAVAGMARRGGEISSEKPIIGLTSFGFITQGAMRVKALLEERGYEVAAFHTNGTGGMAMEDLIDQGLINGVLDFSLHEFSDQLYDGYCAGIGPGRLESAGRRGLPQVVVPGGLDCIVLEFDSIETMPPEMRDRKVFWYDFRSGVRTSTADVVSMARTISDKLNRAQGPTKFMIPLRGWSEADAPGGPLYEPETNQRFIDEFEARVNPKIEIVKANAHINDDAFTTMVVSQLDAMMKMAS